MTAPPPDPVPAAAAPPRPGSFRRRSRRIRHFFRRLFTVPLMWLAEWTVPYLYLASMWFVWKTSRVEDRGISRIIDLNIEYDGVVAALWHEEVFTVAYGYRQLNGHTLASHGDAGRIITRMLKLCNFTVFRGGSSRKASRRATNVLKTLIEHMKTTERVMYGITVDGSAGPPFRMKKGAVAIASACEKPLVLVRTWYKRYFRLPTWDGTAVPLPFNVIHQRLIGPFFPPGPEADPAELAAFREDMEARLLALADESYRAFDQEVPTALTARAAALSAKQ